MSTSGCIVIPLALVLDCRRFVSPAVRIFLGKCVHHADDVQTNEADTQNPLGLVVFSLALHLAYQPSSCLLNFALITVVLLWWTLLSLSRSPAWRHHATFSYSLFAVLASHQTAAACAPCRSPSRLTHDEYRAKHFASSIFKIIFNIGDLTPPSRVGSNHHFTLVSLHYKWVALLRPQACLPTAKTRKSKKAHYIRYSIVTMQIDIALFGQS